MPPECPARPGCEPPGLPRTLLQGLPFTLARRARLLGRMNAAVRSVVWGTLPIGGLLGGAFGTLLGVRPTLWIAFCGSWAAGLWVFFSPLRKMRDF